MTRLARSLPASAGIGAAVLLLLALAGVLAPLITTGEPLAIHPLQRLRPPDAQLWFGADHLGRDLYTRVVYGARVSLQAGLWVALAVTVAGVAIGLLAGFVRVVDAVAMRLMEGIMAIPGILIAITLAAFSKPSLFNVVLAISVPETPAMVRLVRGLTLSLREQPYVQASVAVGGTLPVILLRHILPNALPSIIVQATYVAASAIISEAILSFLGAGSPPEIPSWGNILAEGRQYISVAVWILVFPGLFLTLTVLAVNVLGDGLRDRFDPRMRRS